MVANNVNTVTFFVDFKRESLEKTAITNRLIRYLTKERLKKQSHIAYYLTGKHKK